MVRSLQNDPRHEEAYQLAKDGASLAAISDLLGIPRGTLARWSQQGGWRGRIQEERAEERTRLANQLSGFLGTEVVASFHHIRHLRDNARNETVQLNAAKSLIEAAKDIQTFIERLQRDGLIIDGSVGEVIELSPVNEDELTDEDLEDRQRLRVMRT